jgi:hypothetical protein
MVEMRRTSRREKQGLLEESLLDGSVCLYVVRCIVECGCGKRWCLAQCLIVRDSKVNSGLFNGMVKFRIV